MTGASGVLRVASEHFRAGRRDAAATLARLVLALCPAEPEAKLLLGRIAYVDHRFDEADRLFSRVATLQPQNVAALNLLGMVARCLRREADAVAWFRHAVALQPTSAPLLHNVASAYRAAGRQDEAAWSLRRTLVLDPLCAAAALDLAEVVPPDAILLARYALALQPDAARAWRALGRAETGDVVLAILRRAVRLMPTDVATLYGLAPRLADRQRFAEAAQAYRTILSLKPDEGQALFALGSALIGLVDLAAAAETLERCSRSEPTLAHPHILRARVLLLAGNSRGGLAALGCCSTLPNLEPLYSLFATYLLPNPAAGNAEIRDVLTGAVRPMLATLAPAAPPPAPRVRGDEPLGLGFFLHFAAEPYYMSLFAGVLRTLDRRRFRVRLYCDDRGFRLPGPEWTRTAGLSNDDVAAAMAADQVGVLVDLSSYWAQGRAGLLARHPAPLVVSWLNALSTTGLPGVDALLADDIVVPPGEEGFFAEEILRLPGCHLLWDSEKAAPPVSDSPWLASGVFTFGCLGSDFKIHPDTITAWAEILKRVPESRFLLRNRRSGGAFGAVYYRRQFAEAGIDPDRLELIGPGAYMDFLSTYGHVDVALDTYPWNGGTATADALWQGVPLITFRGDRWAGRMSATILSAAGLKEWIADDRQGYIDLAVDLARRRQELRERRHTQRAHLAASMLCDAQGFTRCFESVLTDAARRRGLSV